MAVTDIDIKVKVWELRARDAGKDAGASAATWLEPGDKENAARILWMMRGGDPAAVDYLPREPDLSGEMADGPTPRSVLEEIADETWPQLEQLGTDEQLGEWLDAVSTAWEEGVSDTFALMCETALMRVAEPTRGNDLDAFVEGYMVCALWSSTDGEENPLDDKYSTEDIELTTRQEMFRECAQFVKDNLEALELFSELTGRDMGSHGHDLWLTRNGHGAGYWDRYLEVAAGFDREHAKMLGQRLSVPAREMGEYNICDAGERIERM